jgi:hypothetical protein
MSRPSSVVTNAAAIPVFIQLFAAITRVGVRAAWAMREKDSGTFCQCSDEARSVAPPSRHLRNA